MQIPSSHSSLFEKSAESKNHQTQSETSEPKSSKKNPDSNVAIQCIHSCVFKTMLLVPHLWTKNSSLFCWLLSPSRSAMKTKPSTFSPYWIPEVKLRTSSNMLRKLLNWKAQVAQPALVLSTEMILKLMPLSYVSPSRQEAIRLYSIRPTLWLFRI